MNFHLLNFSISAYVKGVKERDENKNLDAFWFAHLFIKCGAGNQQFSGNKRRFGQGKNKHSVPNAHVRPEVKNLEQIRKERQKKANKIQHMKNNKPTRGKKSGKRGSGRKAK